MSSPGRGALRVLRGSVLALTCLVLSVAAHLLAGGGLALGWFDLMVAGLLCGACVAVADQRRGPGLVIGVVAATQVVLHLISGGHAGASVAVLPSVPMLLSHLVAIAVVGGLLTSGERLVWVLHGLLRRLVGALPVRLPAPCARRSRTGSRRQAVDAVGARVSRWATRRGPPQGSFA